MRLQRPTRCMPKNRGAGTPACEVKPETAPPVAGVTQHHEQSSTCLQPTEERGHFHYEGSSSEQDELVRRSPRFKADLSTTSQDNSGADNRDATVTTEEASVPGPSLHLPDSIESCSVESGGTNDANMSSTIPASEEQAQAESTPPQVDDAQQNSTRDSHSSHPLPEPTELPKPAVKERTNRRKAKCPAKIPRQEVMLEHHNAPFELDDHEGDIPMDEDEEEHQFMMEMGEGDMNDAEVEHWMEDAVEEVRSRKGRRKATTPHPNRQAASPGRHDVAYVSLNEANPPMRHLLNHESPDDGSDVQPNSTNQYQAYLRELLPPMENSGSQGPTSPPPQGSGMPRQLAMHSTRMPRQDEESAGEEERSSLPPFARRVGEVHLSATSSSESKHPEPLNLVRRSSDSRNETVRARLKAMMQEKSDPSSPQQSDDRRDDPNNNAPLNLVVPKSQPEQPTATSASSTRSSPPSSVQQQQMDQVRAAMMGAAGAASSPFIPVPGAFFVPMIDPGFVFYGQIGSHIRWHNSPGVQGAADMGQIRPNLTAAGPGGMMTQGAKLPSASPGQPPLPPPDEAKAAQAKRNLLLPGYGYKDMRSTHERIRTPNRYRTRYTDEQTQALEHEYRAHGGFISITRKEELSKSICLSYRQIKNWFQNRRAKERRQHKRAAKDCLPYGMGLPPRNDGTSSNDGQGDSINDMARSLTSDTNLDKRDSLQKQDTPRPPAAQETVAQEYVRVAEAVIPARESVAASSEEKPEMNVPQTEKEAVPPAKPVEPAAKDDEEAMFYDVDSDHALQIVEERRHMQKYGEGDPFAPSFLAPGMMGKVSMVPLSPNRHAGGHPRLQGTPTSLGTVSKAGQNDGYNNIVRAAISPVEATKPGDIKLGSQNHGVVVKEEPEESRESYSSPLGLEEPHNPWLTWKTRTKFSEEQILVLETAFANNQLPTGWVKAQLSQVTGLTMRHIHVWFMNRRRKEKHSRKRAGRATTSPGGRGMTPSQSRRVHWKQLAKALTPAQIRENQERQAAAGVPSQVLPTTSVVNPAPVSTAAQFIASPVHLPAPATTPPTRRQTPDTLKSLQQQKAANGGASVTSPADQGPMDLTKKESPRDDKSDEADVVDLSGSPVPFIFKDDKKFILICDALRLLSTSHLQLMTESLRALDFYIQRCSDLDVTKFRVLYGEVQHTAECFSIVNLDQFSSHLPQLRYIMKHHRNAQPPETEADGERRCYLRAAWGGKDAEEPKEKPRKERQRHVSPTTGALPPSSIVSATPQLQQGHPIVLPPGLPGAYPFGLPQPGMGLPFPMAKVSAVQSSYQSGLVTSSAASSQPPVRISSVFSLSQAQGGNETSIGQ
ncbi:hypothetical protein Bbelb_111190 [Branchiostoma belcheri]|nr:hypothetical protein Bbelb_111190 [Branchiostoma belcheri]